METINIMGMSEYLQEIFLSDDIRETLQKVTDNGVVLLRELSGEPTDDISVKLEDVAAVMPAELLPVLMKIIVNAEDHIAPDSRNEETIRNLIILSSALLAMSSATMDYLKIANDVDGLTLK